MSQNNQQVETIVDALMSAIRSTVRETGQQPDLSLITTMLASALNENADQIAGMSNHEITSVSIKTREIKKAANVAAGNVFVCLVDDRYFYGRVLDQLQLGTLVEFYDIPSKHRLTLNEVYAREPKPIMHRYLFANSLFNNPNCRIIGVRPVPKNHDYPLFFLVGGTLHHPRNKKQPWLQPEHVQKLDPVFIYPGNQILENLSKFGLKKVWPETAACRIQVLKVLAIRGTMT